MVPPLKSTPSGTPCQNSMERMPATLKISEKERKYHFLPRKSIFVLRKNSTNPSGSLDTMFASELLKSYLLLPHPTQQKRRMATKFLFNQLTKSTEPRPPCDCSGERRKSRATQRLQ